MAKRRFKAKTRIGKLREKYRHLDLMKGLVEARKEERQPDSKTLHAISARSVKVLDKSVTNLKKGLASTPIVKSTKAVRPGTLKGRMKIKGDIIRSDMEGDWEARSARNKARDRETRSPAPGTGALPGKNH